MTAAKPDLVMLTGRFPNGEAVLGGELAVTAQRFARVFVIPSHPGRPGAEASELPDNATVVDLGWRQGWSRSEKRSVLSSPLALRILARTLRRPSNWRAYAAGARVYLDILAENLLKARSLAAWVEENELREALFYDFWFENSTLALAALRQQGTIRCAVARAHRFDAFDFEEAGLRRVPFREFKADHLDAIFPIAEDSAGYMRERVGANAEKVRLARLGVPFPAAYPQTLAEPSLVVSCSSLIPRKQVHLIPEVLRACERPLRWVHFGEGSERPRVEAAALLLPDTVSWELPGRVENTAVRDFYAEHGVSAFLSLSLSEGVPVSMMEAQSYGVPIVALAVGGVPEIVQAGTGTLLPADAGASEVAAALSAALDPDSFGREAVRAAFSTRYDASANYREFADALLSLWSENVPTSS
jgi:glycosyltransferase involved in cell wall biosynthesis